MSALLTYALQFLFVLPAIILHEIAHGYAAYMLGDPTAKRAKRLSLNPVRHIDPVGTLLLPAVLLLASGGRAAFGYAKPVPVNPSYFKNYRVGFFITAIAGPATNVALAAISSVAARMVDPSSIAFLLLVSFAQLNLVLVFFNLIPIPPLDGSRVIPLFLSDSGMRKFAQIEQYGFGILMVLLWGVPTLLHVDPIGVYLDLTVDPILRLLLGA